MDKARGMSTPLTSSVSGEKPSEPQGHGTALGTCKVITSNHVLSFPEMGTGKLLKEKLT